jgi:hypothetical protein
VSSENLKIGRRTPEGATATTSSDFGLRAALNDEVERSASARSRERIVREMFWLAPESPVRSHPCVRDLDAAAQRRSAPRPRSR